MGENKRISIPQWYRDLFLDAKFEWSYRFQRRESFKNEMKFHIYITIFSHDKNKRQGAAHNSMPAVEYGEDKGEDDGTKSDFVD